MLDGDSVVGENTVGVMDDGDSVLTASGDTPIVEGVSGSVGSLGKANVIGEDGTGRVVGVSDNTDDVSG
jgi:hypothetical protein